MPKRKEREPVIVQTVEKGIRILDTLSELGPMGVTDLARRITDNPSTVYRILSTFCAYGLVEQDPETNRYRLGLGLLRLSSSLWQSMDLRRVARPIMERLRDDTGETINLMVRDGAIGIYIETVESTQSVRRVGEVGRREPLHASGVGKAILAYLLPAEMERVVVKGLERFTPNTITDVESLRDHLRVVRERGFAIDDEEAEIGTRCIGVPIFGRTGEVEAALSIAGPEFRMNRERLVGYAGLLKDAAEEISRRIGYVKREARAIAQAPHR